MPIYDLDTDQSLAATAPGGEVAISAGAGSGKTRLLVSRYLYYIKKEKLPLSSIAAITFTNKASDQMKARIYEKACELAENNPDEHEMWMDVAENVHHAPISTIHSFCSSILRSHPVEAGLDPFFTVIDEVTNSRLKNNAVKSFVELRLAENPDDISFLVNIFGMEGLKKILRGFIEKRTFMVKFLDSNEDSGVLDTENLRLEYKKSMLKTVEKYVYLLEEFHAFRPDGDKITIVYDMLDECFSKIRDMLEKDDVDTSYINYCLDNIILKGGSPKKWGRDRLNALKSALKECRSFLNAIASYYEDESGVTAQAASFLLRDYTLLDNFFLEQKKSRSCLDNDDIIIETWKLLRTNSRLCQKISRSYRHILVDEFQDTDGMQMDILRMITGNTTAVLFAVGDPKQSIYRFRGADVTVFKEYMLKANFKSLKTNYRSAPSILNFVNAAFGAIMGDEPSNIFEAPYIKMKPKRLDNGGSHDVEIAVIDKTGKDSYRLYEAEFIARRALQLNTGAADGGKYSFGNMALLLRKGTATSYYEEAFLRNGIPFINLAGGRLSKTPEIYDIGNLLTWLESPDDPALLTAVLLSPFFYIDSDTLFRIRMMSGTPEKIPAFVLEGRDTSPDKLIESSDFIRARKILNDILSIRDRLSIREILERVFDKTGYTMTLLADKIKGERSLAILDLLLETADIFEHNGGALGEFADLILSGESLTRESAHVETKDDVLSIMTIHRAKGLEFKVVFLADITSTGRHDMGEIIFESDLGPGFKIRDAHGGTIKTYPAWKAEKMKKEKDIAESKRLFYVGCTRAEDRLIISGAQPPKDLDATYEKDNWINWLHTAFSIPQNSDLHEYTSEMFLYRRISRETGAADYMKTAYWKELLESSGKESSSENDAVDRLIAPIESVPYSGAPEHISPTQLIDYILCPALYTYKHVQGLDIPQHVQGLDITQHVQGLDITQTEKDSERMGSKYGSLAHAVLEKINFNDAGSWKPVIDSFASKDIPERLKDKLNEELLKFSESDLYSQIRNSEEIRREMTFTFNINDVLIRGKIDIVYRFGNDTVIVDYKTGEMTADKLDDYRLQLGIYALALNRAEYSVPSKLVVHSLTSGESHEISCSSALLDEIADSLTVSLNSMASGDFDPVYSGRCDSCLFKEMCGI